MLNLVLITLLVVLLYKTLVFLLSLLFKRNDIADISWGTSFILVVLLTAFLTGSSSYKFLIISTLVLIWGIRLAVRIFIRNRAKKEDFRYKKIREETKGQLFYIRTFLQVYMLQGLLAVVVCLPIIVTGFYKSSLTLFSFIGIVIWIIGFIFESIGDYQLDEFKKSEKNKGKVLKTGLWKYSRHPNYFGEIVMWWGIFLISFPPVWIITVLSPLTITFLITKVSGIPLLEKHYEGNLEFEEYKKHTSVLIPLPKR